VSTCKIAGRDGLLLIEAKAHDRELEEEGKRPGDSDNHKQIGAAIEEANRELNAIIPGWHLSRYSHYQLSNRFTWAWKLAALGTPTILAYVGFLGATEMVDQGQPLRRWPNGSHQFANTRPTSYLTTPLNARWRRGGLRCGRSSERSI